jgi:hypothetical protein
LHIPPDGTPYLAGARCADCGQVYLVRPVACPRCFSRREMAEVALSERGRLYSYTIVHRSFPGVKVPFVMAVVDLEDGATLRGTLANIAHDPAAIRFDMPVRLAFRDSGQTDAAGQPYLSYIFVPDEEAGAR